MMITTRFSLLCILDFVKEIVEDLSYNPDRSPVPGIIFVPTVSFVPPQNNDNLIPGTPRHWFTSFLKGDWSTGISVALMSRGTRSGIVVLFILI